MGSGGNASGARGNGRQIAIANVRGGVGKSTTSMMLAEGLALKQLRVLVLDIDPQAMVSELLLRFGGLRQVVKDRRTLAHVLGRFAQGKALKLALTRMPASTSRNCTTSAGAAKLTS